MFTIIDFNIFLPQIYCVSVDRLNQLHKFGPPDKNKQMALPIQTKLISDTLLLWNQMN